MGRFLVLILLATALSACVTSEAPERADPTVPARWLALRGEAPAWPSADWWRAFRDPELDAVIASVQAANTDLAVAAERLVQARARARVSAAPLSPTVDLSATQSATRRGSLRSEAYGFGLDATYELDVWGRNRAIAGSGQASAEASRYDREVVAITVTTDAATAYFNLVSLRERIAITRRILRTSERVLGVVTTRVAEGGGTRIDLAQQRALVLGQRAALSVLQQREFAARVALATLMGRPVQAMTIRGERLPSSRLEPVRPGLPSSLLARRPDIRRADAELAVAGADVDAARAAMLPRIALTGSGGLSSVALGALLNSGSLIAAVGSSLAQPIIDGGRLAAERDAALSRRSERLVLYRAAVHAAFSDVDLALNTLQRLTEQEALQRRQLAELQQAFTLAEERYRAGADDLLKLLDVQRSLTLTEDQLAQTRAQRVQAHVALIGALGGGWLE